MGLNTDIAEVNTQIDKILNGRTDKWLDASDYDLKSKDHKNMKSAHGLIHDILHHIFDGQRIIDRTHKDSLKYLYEKCIEHLSTSK